MFQLTWIVDGKTIQSVTSPSKSSLATLWLILRMSNFSPRLWNKDKSLCY
jgi:hypothetical protein